MLILGVESPQGEKTYVAAAFPSACGKTNFAMLIPPAGFEGWKVWTVGDDIAWIKPDAERPSARHQSGSGLLRRGARHLGEDQSKRDGDAAQKHDLHQRGADAGRRCLVGRHDRRSAGRMHGLAGQPLDSGNRQGNRRQGSASERALHRARVAMPDDRSGLGDPEGVPISAIIFGGRRATTMPLVYQAFNWSAGVYIGRDHGLGNDRGGRGRHRARFAAIPWPCCRSAAITWAIISVTGSRCSAR